MRMKGTSTYQTVETITLLAYQTAFGLDESQLVLQCVSLLLTYASNALRHLCLPSLHQCPNLRETRLRCLRVGGHVEEIPN